MTAPFQTLPVVWQERCSVMEQAPAVVQQVPTGQGFTAQVEPKPCQTPKPHCVLAVPGGVTVQAKGEVVLLQQAPTQGFGAQREPLPM